jgi:hypothetical protein
MQSLKSFDSYMIVIFYVKNMLMILLSVKLLNKKILKIEQIFLNSLLPLPIDYMKKVLII